MSVRDGRIRRKGRLQAGGAIGLAMVMAVSWAVVGRPDRAMASSGTVALAATPGPASCAPLTRYRWRDFPLRPTIDNSWLPMRPGDRLAFVGTANRGQGTGVHRVELTITDLTKWIGRVRAIVAWDNDIQDGTLVESELAFFAQDRAGNVWNLGEYPEEYEEGKLVGAPNTWLTGRHGAVAGVAVPGRPRLGSGWYLQGSVPEIDFLDCAKVTKLDRDVCVPLRCFDDVMLIDERSPLDPGSGTQRKAYARDVGNIQISAVADPEGETLSLVERRRLAPREVAAARAAALRMDARGRTIAPVYAGSAPLRLLPPADD